MNVILFIKTTCCRAIFFTCMLNIYLQNDTIQSIISIKVFKQILMTARNPMRRQIDSEATFKVSLQWSNKENQMMHLNLVSNDQ